MNRLPNQKVSHSERYEHFHFNRLSITEGTFKRCNCATKVARIVLALLLVVASLGMILAIYSFKNLLDVSFCRSSVNTLPLSQIHARDEPKLLPESPQLSPDLNKPLTHTKAHKFSSTKLTKHSRILSRFQPLSPAPPQIYPPVKDYAEEFASLGISCPLTYENFPIVLPWQAEEIIAASEYLHQKYPHLVPMSPLSTATIFNLVDLIKEDLSDACRARSNYYVLAKNSCHIKETRTINNQHPISCKQASVFAYPLWHHPEGETAKLLDQCMYSQARISSHGGAHWALVIVDIEKRRVVFFDSLGTYVKRKLIEPALHTVAVTAGKICTPMLGERKTFDVIISNNESIQIDNNSCGIWITLFLKNYMKNPNWNLPSKQEANKMLLGFMRHLESTKKCQCFVNSTS